MKRWTENCLNNRTILASARELLTAQTVTAIMAVVSFTCVSGQDFFPPDQLGPFSVGHEQFEFVNESRDSRTLLTEVWYPVDTEDAIGTLTTYEIADFLFPSAVALDSPAVSSAGPFPMLVYSHGDIYLESAAQSSLAETLASHGFVVAAPNHFTDAFIHISWEGAGQTRALDVSHVIDQMLDKNLLAEDPFHAAIDVDNIGLAGHSSGGFTAFLATSGFENLNVPPDPRVDAIMPISPGGFGDAGMPISQTQSDVPTFLLNGTRDFTSDISRNLFGGSLRNTQPRFLGAIEGADHFSYLDRCNRRDYVMANAPPDSRVRELWEPMVCDEEGIIPNDEAIRLTNHYAVSFFKNYLTSEDGYEQLLTTDFPSANGFPVKLESDPEIQPTLPVVELNVDGGGAIYSQDFDALGIDGMVREIEFPVGWSSNYDGGVFRTKTTQSFPIGSSFDNPATINAGADNDSDRTLAIGRGTRNSDVLLQFLASVTESDATSLQLTFDIEAWDARQIGGFDIADNPGEAAFNVSVEVDSGDGFLPLLDFGKVTTGAILQLPDGAYLDGNADPNLVSFDTGVHPAIIPADSMLRILWAVDNEAQSWGWVFGLDDVELSLFSDNSLTGDFNSDNVLDTADVDSLVSQIVAGLPFDPLFDLTGDGVVDDVDLSKWLSDAAIQNGFAEAYLPGDSDLNGSVDSTDLNNIALSWRQNVSAWSKGDFTADGSVDSGDLNALALNWRQSIPTAIGVNASVPEPATWLMIVVGLALAWRRRVRS